MAIVLDGKSLTLDKLVRIARHGEAVELAPESLDKIRACRAVIEEKIKAHEIMYGVNTGIGEFSEIVLDDEQVKQFQRYLIYNHAAGIGKPAPIEHVRAALLSRVLFANSWSALATVLLLVAGRHHALYGKARLGWVATGGERLVARTEKTGFAEAPLRLSEDDAIMLAAMRLRDAQHLTRRERILEEQLEEIAHAVEQQAVLRLCLQAEILRHHGGRGGVRHHGAGSEKPRPVKPLSPRGEGGRRACAAEG